MIDKRPQADRILVAQLMGEARHHAKWRELTEDEHAAAVAELRELAGGRADLLAEVAGILEGTSEGQLDEPLARQAAGLCRTAGADPEALPTWSPRGGAGQRMPGGYRSPIHATGPATRAADPKLSRRGDARTDRLAGGRPRALPSSLDSGRAAPEGCREAAAVLGPADPPRGRITTMTETPDMNDVAAAALRLISAFEHGHSVGALEAVLAADPLVIATALGLLASPVAFTVQCTACGAPVQAEHDPVAAPAGTVCVPVRAARHRRLPKFPCRQSSPAGRCPAIREALIGAGGRGAPAPGCLKLQVRLDKLGACARCTRSAWRGPGAG